MPHIQLTPIVKKSATQPMKVHGRMWEYGVAMTIAGILFVVLSVYLYYRRGYYDLYIANKIFAGTSAILLGIVLLLGPLSRAYTIFDRWLKYRKEIGIVAFVLALAHSVSSFFFLSDYFSRARFFTSGLWPFVFGITALSIVCILWILSHKNAVKIFSGKVWWCIHSWGIRCAFIAVALHVGIMKFSGWVDWYKNGGASNLVHPEWPGAGLLVGWIIAYVFSVRISEIGKTKAPKVIIPVGFFLLIGIFVATFLWGRII
ncbi:MAG: hypothetical protein UV70_C0006G0002 [Parcubacteria group bacterium GW2011_GWA2_43_13]|nr:MAG: hypothetical protein UV70_C0006G0002 [Parcubacteria group bacterium GW2011_GWA2_43_13]